MPAGVAMHMSDLAACLSSRQIPTIVYIWMVTIGSFIRMRMVLGKHVQRVAWWGQWELELTAEGASKLKHVFGKAMAKEGGTLWR